MKRAQNRFWGKPMSPRAGPNINLTIWTAIEQKRLLRFRHENRERIVEPRLRDSQRYYQALRLPGSWFQQPETAHLAVGGAGPDVGYPNAGPDLSWWPPNQV